MSFRNFLNSFVGDIPGGGGGFAPPPRGQYGFMPPAAPPTAEEQKCPRPFPQAGFTDWFVLQGFLSFAPFHVCPHCYNVQVKTTAFTRNFARTPVPTHIPISCDLARFWVLLGGAVLHAFNEDRQLDLSILPRVKAILVSDGDCPNARLIEGRSPPAVTQQMWYTIRDAQGMFPLPAWTVCMHCVVNIQTIFPAIADTFAPVTPGPVMGSCAIMPGDGLLTHRNAALTNCLRMSKDSTRQTRVLDMSPLVNAIRGDSVLMPYSLCPRNVSSQILKCHTMREIPELTVCEGCYAASIKPDVQRGLDLAKLVNTMPTPYPGGFTCQLYSDRMRCLWAEAAAKGDIEFLRQKLFERRVKERELKVKIEQLKHQQDLLLMQIGMTQANGEIATEVEMGRILNNSMLSNLGYVSRIDDYTYTPLNTTADLSGMMNAGRQGSSIQMQNAQIEEQIKFAGEEWIRYWE